MWTADADGAARHRLAPAKVNLALHVTGRRPDGYHLLDMLVAFADIGDRVTWRPGGSACRLSVDDRLLRPEPVPVDTSNLAWRALALAGRLGAAPLAGDLTVEKSLPSGAGIGGGSSDAAAVLRLLLTETATDEAFLQAQAVRLGADLPVCLAGRPTRVQGIGERLTPVALAHALAVVLVWPGEGLSTPAVFRARAAEDRDAIPATAIDALAQDPLGAIADLRNDLEEAARALLPAVGHAADALRESAGCRLVRMSGSGSTVVGYFADGNAAAEAADRISAGAPHWWVRAGVLQA
ncbi:4-(cytidine 5'-diphospho)-2-C-methyl-D-erythritol kinase [Thalassobaculum sp. OXR-137]|uniref:4-(cytidine 5'-diphospho)-2-C-methyl-D-erythritol kinase n=1 Tax=Thalassobaculum sp. OXR-137 TaxID=3100173 RepID=UPI002AC9C1CD|nr:4-(cytidine 5'-diphospho)-2-C-methyl-D-erythritol kinase [Thalassobaculum sp. OXR-137]WPZ35457.1 4-(cytidine 5'-diphospho)-2-C-methyl-D-erythritol kinase [Thalassobaculum sp. OXR-137]